MKFFLEDEFQYFIIVLLLLKSRTEGRKYYLNPIQTGNSDNKTVIRCQ